MSEGEETGVKCSIPLQEAQIPACTPCMDLLSNLGSHPPEKCCHYWEKVLKGPHSQPQNAGAVGELRVAIFMETFVSKQRALCQLL
jgi:hypothetical protein